MKYLFFLKNVLYFLLAKFIFLYRKKLPTNIWLFGENLGCYARDNGYVFFKYCDLNYEPANCYFVYDPKRFNDIHVLNKGNLRNFVKINSLRHYLLYMLSDLNFVSHGIRDILPFYIAHHPQHNVKPIIYLQHGIIAFKKIYYNNQSYNKNIIRFVTSYDFESEIVNKKMMPKNIEEKINYLEWCLESFKYNIVSNLDSKHKFMHGKILNLCSDFSNELIYLKNLIGINKSRIVQSGLPRHDEMLSLSTEKSEYTYILYFPTWREWLLNENDFINSVFFNSIISFCSNEQLISSFIKNKIKMRVLVHPSLEKHAHLFTNFSNDTIQIVDNANFQKEIFNASILITDYSSLAWDFIIQNKEVIFFQCDQQEYASFRGSYINFDETLWKGKIFKETVDLVSYLSVYPFSDHQIEACLPSYVNNKNSERLLKNISQINKKIYYIVYNIYGIGGTVRTVINQANWLYNNGFEIEIISLRKTSAIPTLNLNPGIKLSFLYDARRGSYKPDRKIGIIRNLQRLKVRVLHKLSPRQFCKDEDLYENLTLFTEHYLKKRIRLIRNSLIIGTIPSITIFSKKYAHPSVTVFAQEHRFFEGHRPSLQNHILNNYSNLDGLMVLTNDDLEAYKTKISSINVKVVYNGTVIPPKYTKSLKETINIVTLARFEEVKQIDKLISAFSLVYKKNNNVKLDIYGDGPLKASLQDLIITLGLEDVIFIHQPIKNIGDVLMKSDIYALTSSSESFSMTIIEAFSYSVPVVCFDIPYGPKALVQHQKNGLKAQAFDVEDLAEQILTLASDEQMRILLGNNGREFALRFTSIESTSKQLINFIGPYIINRQQPNI